MSDARNKILHRIQRALHDVPTIDTPQLTYNTAIDRSYRHHAENDREEIIANFVERVTEYKATVRRVSADDLAETIANTLTSRQVKTVVVPSDLTEEWLPADVDLLRDTGELSYATLGESDGVLTGCAIGIAQTGTIVMDHGVGQGRRAISLVPDYHLCIVRAEQVVGLVPEAITQLADAVHAGQPFTFISGPSATSDIELNRVEGVHGPRTLDVLVVS